MLRNIRTVACAISGGVDSSVSAYLLKKKGFKVKGVFMTNWDPLDEGLSCSINKDREDAKRVCEHLKIPFFELNFVREYWQFVFEPLIQSYEFGATPNPDVLCNRFVKFNLLLKSCLRGPDSPSRHVADFEADAIATGHYCQNSLGNFLEKALDCEAQLLRSADPVKDQTFWLSTISHESLRHCMFPVGNLRKPIVKEIAAEIGLQSIAVRRESMGMCFIGKRRFSDFIDSYIESKIGLFKELETGVVLDEHRGVHHFTLGQRAHITRDTGPFYVASLDPLSQTVYVVHDKCHPSLFMRKCWTGPAVWINSFKPTLPTDCMQFQWQNKWRPVNCQIMPFNTVREAADAARASSMREISRPLIGNYLPTILPGEASEAKRNVGPCLLIDLVDPMRCVAPGQWAALYVGNRCVGGVMICGSISLWDEGQSSSYTDWDYTNYELHY
ncbi:tRNA 5-methylaminomethyl-2-thiouridylate methyltransferase [Fasciolopsis buskii]|uniref:tRNA-5-taurinomethyluridine 2-sulfurtransferase n=1 Tax=Fasciolopsis buskii TaxID=27845 RepID=A0A8E0RIL7_9TREM|nr:tRNA 5-methylaminomethyl-2-thiouridylate methyltransferase [Fasciolopsis buski]